MIFVIGDIHGELAKLKRLIKVISTFQVDKLIFVGDYLDKGPNPKKTLDFLELLAQRIPCVFLEGDHERAWLNKDFDFLRKYGGERTLASFGLDDYNSSKIESEILDRYSFLFNNLKRNVVIGNYLVIHTGSGSRYKFLLSPPKDPNQIIIFGHTAFYTPYVDQYKIGVDTGAVYFADAPLTAFEITQKFFVNHFGDKKSLATIVFNSCPTIIRQHDTW